MLIRNEISIETDEDAPFHEIRNLILKYAADGGYTIMVFKLDIKEEKVTVMFKKEEKEDGERSGVLSIPYNGYKSLIEIIKIDAGISLNDKNLEQYGTFDFRFNGLRYTVIVTILHIEAHEEVPEHDILKMNLVV